jgi:peroxiredoxin
MKIIRYLFIISLFSLLAVGPNSSIGGDKNVVSPLDADKQTNTKAPDFTLKDLNGTNVSLSSLKGKVVLLNFWASWCPPCKAEMPSMNKLYKEIRAKGFEIVAVSTDNSLSTIKEFLAKSRVDFTVLFDEKKTVSREYKVFSMPTTFLIDRNGFIVEKYYGEYDWTDPEVKKQIKKLL